MRAEFEPHRWQRMKRKIAAILAADIAGYSRLVADDEEDTLRRLASYREVFADFVAKAQGRIFNTAGDSVLAEFGSAVEATRCAIDVQESLRTRNLGYPQTRQMLFRIGITIGDVVEREGDLLGDGVNIAARLEGLATPGGICVSRSVYEQVANKLSVPFRDIGEQEVKNIPQPVHAFMIDMPGGEARHPTAPSAKNSAPAAAARAPVAAPWALFLAGAGLALGLAAFAIVLVRPLMFRALWGPAHRAGNLVDQRPLLTPQGTTPADAFAALARSGGIIADAKTPAELYHNARNFEARGNPVASRRAYLALVSQGIEAIDPHLRFAALLRAQEGRAGAREIYGRLQETTGGRVAALIYALQFDAEEQRKRIEAFVAANPDYAPAEFLLANEYSEERLGTQTLADKRREFAALSGFLKADAEGRLAAFFLDQSMLAEWVDRARRRHAALQAFLHTARDQPTASFLRSNAGWTVSLSLPEPAISLSYRLGGRGDFRETGTLAALDERTGKPFPLTSFELPPDEGATTIEVRYVNASGLTQGPFSIPFDPHAALIKSERDILERFWNSWIALRPDAAAEWRLYFTQLVSYRCAIAKAEIGLDGPPSTLLPMPACDEHEPHAIPSDFKPYMSVPARTRSVSVQLTYADGTRSETKAFRAH